MSNPFDEIRTAVIQARMQLKAADDAANEIAELLIGRLDKVNPWRLAKLKKELSRFDAHRKGWK